MRMIGWAGTGALVMVSSVVLGPVALADNDKTPLSITIPGGGGGNKGGGSAPPPAAPAPAPPSQQWTPPPAPAPAPPSQQWTPAPAPAQQWTTPPARVKTPKKFGTIRSPLSFSRAPQMLGSPLRGSS